MRRWIALGLLLSLSSCATQELQPALPDTPVLLEPLIRPAITDDAIPMRDCPSTAVPYQHLRAGKRGPVQVRLEPTVEGQPVSLSAPAPLSPPKTKPLDVDKLIAQANKAALVRPTEQGYFGGRAVYRYTYTPGKVYVIYTSPQQFTKLYFPLGEKAATLPTLNEEQWKTVTARIGPPGRTQEVLGVRPVEETLTTDIAMEMESGRSYFLRLQTSKTPMVGVTWEVPQILDTQESEEMRGMETASHAHHPCAGSQQGMLMPVDLATLHTGYKIETKGTPGFVPTQVFDDGRRTLIKLRRLTGNAPVVFTYKPDGSRGLVQFAPYAIPDDPQRALYYIVESLWPKIELAGTDGASVIITRLSEGIATAQPWQRH